MRHLTLFLCVTLFSVTRAPTVDAQLVDHYELTHWEVGIVALDGEYTETQGDIRLSYSATPPTVGTSATVTLEFDRPEEQEYNLTFVVELEEIAPLESGRQYIFKGGNTVNVVEPSYVLAIRHYDQPEEFGGGFQSAVQIGFAKIQMPGTRVMGFLARPAGAISTPPSSGSGTFAYEGGITCTGEWASGVLHGQARCDFPDGSWYDGTWASGKRNGSGRASGEGDVYEGTWKDDHFASGSVVSAEGVRFEGTWEGWGPTGSGTATYPNGDVYSGAIVSGQRHGTGTLVSTQGYTLEGSWDGDKRHGQSRATLADGTVMTGEYVNDVAQGPFTYTYTNGRILEITIEDGRKVGERVVYAGDAFEGIGIALRLNETTGQFVVTAIGPNSPASVAGFRVDDIIETVNDESLIGKTLNEVVSLIQGPSGSEVEIGLNRAGERLVVVATRGQIDPADLDGN